MYKCCMRVGMNLMKNQNTIVERLSTLKIVRGFSFIWVMKKTIQQLAPLPLLHYLEHYQV